MSRLRKVHTLRRKGIRWMDALDMCGLSEVPLYVIVGITLFIALLLIVDLHDQYVERQVKQERTRADLNLKVINHIMKGRPLIVEGEMRAVMTCPGLETKL